MEKYGYKFSFGPWNIHEGADPFGPPVRPSVPFDQKLSALKNLGFDAMQFHDDDVVPDLDDKSPDQIRNEAREMKQRLDDLGLVAEFVAPRLWEHHNTVDGAPAVVNSVGPLFSRVEQDGAETTQRNADVMDAFAKRVQTPPPTENEGQFL